jgi:predicted DNA-binding transcriptional regulator AlpA
MRKHTTRPTDPKSTSTPATAVDERIVTEAELVKLISFDRSTIWKMCREGRFPPPIQLSPARKGWRWSRVLAWLDERERNPVHARAYFGRESPDSTP